MFHITGIARPLHPKQLLGSGRGAGRSIATLPRESLGSPAALALPSAARRAGTGRGAAAAVAAGGAGSAGGGREGIRAWTSGILWPLAF